MTMGIESNPWEGHTKVPDTVGNTASSPSEDDSEEEDGEFTYPGVGGDYSTQMEELFDGDEDARLGHKSDDEDEEGGFFYDGVDADTSASYKEQLRDVLGHEDDEDEEEVERSVVLENGRGDDEHLHSNEIFLEGSPDVSSSRALSPDSRVSSPDPRLYPFKLSKPFLHPTVSRLRSFTPQSSRTASNVDSPSSHARGESPVPSQLSSLSRQSSLSNLHLKQNASKSPDVSLDQQVFKWTELQAISQTLYSKASQKASALLGAPILGSPTVLAANGLVCVGTTEGKVVVYDFKQTLICVCETDIPVNTIGAVTAVALSYDHTFVAAGHATGYIQLYNLKHPHNPVRSVPPTTLAAVATGRKEGHLKGSKIISIGFIAGRHTAIVSADDHGLAFFHSLGKVLFIEASDILRILGRYPDLPSGSVKPASASLPNQDMVPVKPSRYSILSMAPLPLGTITHSTDSYHIIALLTPTKLVVVGLRPTPRTWFKCPREMHNGNSRKTLSRWVGALSWFPSILTSVAHGEASANGNDSPTLPMLAFSWGSSLHILSVFESRVKQVVASPKSGKTTDVEVGTVAYEMFGKWSAVDDILALQWLNHNQIIIVTCGDLIVYDLTLSRSVEQVEFNGISSAISEREQNKSLERQQFERTFRVYKGKLFVLQRNKLVVGTLLTWADRILSLVEHGDFLKAIELTRLYYTDEAPGNRNNLPVDPQRRKQVIGERLRRLMEASALYAFSEERMSDSTHATPDGRGVDRTSLFEGIVEVCCKASVALDDFDYLFEDLFQKYDDSGISSIYLRQLEPFVLDSKIRYVPPRITQRLVALHEQDDRSDLVERIIWHMDPSCLDINQTIQLCQRYQMYDALIYVNTRAIRDYVAPVVELLALIRKVQQFRKGREEYVHRTGQIMDADPHMESVIMNAYKVFPYLANILSGVTYPSEEPIDADEAFQAKKDVYSFLFFGRSSIWPPGEGGKLVLTADEEGGAEPTYPYARLLLVFDAEYFLHSLDIALEDGFLHDDAQSTINRLMIVRIILEIMSSSNLPQNDVTMVNIFVARNVPKYHQSLQLPPSSLHGILIGLAEDPNESSREDRQLAAEYLLSVYNPHDSERIIFLFEQAGFYRILRTWHRRDRRWSKLLSAYIEDPEFTSMELLHKVEEVMLASSKANKGTIPHDLVSVISRSLPKYLRTNISATAHLLDYRIPSLHTSALDSFGEGVDADRCRYEYLQALLGPESTDDDYGLSIKPISPSDQISPELRHMFFTLQCRFHPENVIHTLPHFPKDALDLDRILETCESQQVYDAAVWLTNWRGQPRKALSKADTFQKQIIHEVVDTLTNKSEQMEISGALSSLHALARITCNICMEIFQKQGTEESGEEMWFQLLNNQIHAVQLVSASLPSTTSTGTEINNASLRQLLSTLRSLVQTSFAALVSITSTSAVSFPRLFKRLVNSTPSATGSHYTEFRMILTSMLDSYRSDEDLLIILKHLLDRDVFEMVMQATKERACGWTATQGTCQYCRNPLLTSTSPPTSTQDNKIIVSRTGLPSHSHCQPSTILPST